jgi:hypothetical protein
MIKVQTNTYDSSTVISSKYRYAEKELEVTFNHASYVYYQVKEEDYNAFRDATSQGKALNEYIKKYKFSRIEED